MAVSLILEDIVLGVFLVLFGSFWFIYQVKNPVKPKGPMNWTTNLQLTVGSLVTIFLGVLLIIGEASLSMWF